jgi:hypothetical protein
MLVQMMLILLVGFLRRVIIVERFRLLKWRLLIQLAFAFGNLVLGGLDLARKIVLAYRNWSNATDFLAACELQNVSLDSIVDSVTTWVLRSNRHIMSRSARIARSTLERM